MKFGDLFPSKYLKAADISGPIIVRIKSVEIEEVGQEREEKPVLHFTGTETKALILNKTNGSTLCDLFDSEDSEDWTGQKIELFSETILMHGERKPAIRIRKPKAAKAATVTTEPAVDPDDIDEIPDSWEDEPVSTRQRA